MKLDLSREDKIARIRSLPAELHGAVAGLSDAQLDTPYREGGWTVRQVAHHLADAHLNAYVRVKLLLTEDDPLLKTWDQAAWALLPDARTAPIGAALRMVQAVHERLALTLENATPADWRRTARHPETGAVTLDALLDLYAWHGRHHLEQIAALRQRMGW